MCSAFSFDNVQLLLVAVYQAMVHYQKYNANKQKVCCELALLEAVRVGKYNTRVLWEGPSNARKLRIFYSFPVRKSSLFSLYAVDFKDGHSLCAHDGESDE